jgi:hypothetical protein
MQLLNEGDLKAKISPEIQAADQVQKLENLQSCVQKAYKEVRSNNRNSHLKNKSYYDRKAKERKFEVGDQVYLFNQAKKPGRCNKFRPFWQGPFVVVQKVSELNYKIVNSKGKEFVVQVNRLKPSYEPVTRVESLKCPTPRVKKPDAETVEEDAVTASRPIAVEGEPQAGAAEEPRRVERSPRSPESAETPDVVDSVRRDPDYRPSCSPRSRREIDSTPMAPPVTRSRARLQLQEQRHE